MATIDLNSDLGESFGAYTLGNDEEILKLVTSANIACGFHAGDAHVMKRTVALAKENGIAVGAHPGFPDLAGFGRRRMDMAPESVYDIILYQLGALTAFVKKEGTRLQHVKPHGAMYNMAAKEPDLAQAIVQAVHDFDADLKLFAPFQSTLLDTAQKAGVPVVSEVFADRTYQPDGTLTPRKVAHSVLQETSEVLRQVESMLLEGKVTCVDGSVISVTADTLCLHGDNPAALALAKEIRTFLKEKGLTLSAPA